MGCHNRCAEQKLKSLSILKKVYFDTFPQMQKSQFSANTTFSANTIISNLNKQLNNSRIVLQAHKIPVVTECPVHSFKFHQHASIFEDFRHSRHLVHCLICSLIIVLKVSWKSSQKIRHGVWFFKFFVHYFLFSTSETLLGSHSKFLFDNTLGFPLVMLRSVAITVNFCYYVLNFTPKPKDCFV